MLGVTFWPLTQELWHVCTHAHLSPSLPSLSYTHVMMIVHKIIIINTCRWSDIITETYLKNTRDQEQRRHSVNHYGNKVRAVPKCRGRGTTASIFHYWCFGIWFENSKRFTNVNFGLSSLVTAIKMTLSSSSQPLCQIMVMMRMLWVTVWGFSTFNA